MYKHTSDTLYGHVVATPVLATLHLQIYKMICKTLTYLNRNIERDWCSVLETYLLMIQKYIYTVVILFHFTTQETTHKPQKTYELLKGMIKQDFTALLEGLKKGGEK